VQSGWGISKLSSHLSTWIPNARLFSFEAMHGDSFQFTIRFTFLHVLALIELHFAFADAELHFDFAILPVKRERHNGVSLDRSKTEEFSNLALVQKKFSDGFGLVILAIAKKIFLNMGIVQERFVVLDPDESIRNLRFTGTERLDLGTAQGKSSLEGLEDVIIPAGFRVRQNVSHKKRGPEEFFFWPGDIRGKA